MECVADELLTRVSIDVMEKHAFVFPEPGEFSPAAPCPSGALQAHVRFSGPATGELVMFVPGELASEIAADMLGLDPGDDGAEALIHDAVGELANVLCGNVLQATEFKDQVLDLAAPEVSAGKAEVWKNLSIAPQTIGLSVDEHCVLVHFHIKSLFQ